MPQTETVSKSKHVQHHIFKKIIIKISSTSFSNIKFVALTNRGQAKQKGLSVCRRLFVCRRVPLGFGGLSVLADCSYDFVCIYTYANPILLEDEVRIYYGASDFLHFGWREGSLSFAYLRPDGFAGYRVLDTSRAEVLITANILRGSKDTYLS